MDEKKARRAIRNAWIAATVSGIFTVIVALIAVTSDRNPFDDWVTGWELLSAGATFGLAYGIYRKSRACAVVVLLWYVAQQLLYAIETGRKTGFGLALVFIYFYVQGVRGTFAYQKLNTARPKPV
ncbi:MAG: hypothetical protein U1E51_20765 [Candidatus Binatia bacterium]|nr:hypothetical protein [Candidatus Binatia bacterium]